MSTPGTKPANQFEDNFQIDKAIKSLLECNPLTEDQVKELCATAKTILVKEENVQSVKTPVTICGDIHG